MAEKAGPDAAVGVVAVGVALVFVGILTGYTVWVFVVAGLLMIGAVAATARQRRTGPAPDVTLRPGGENRPWRSEDD
ncbi:hypothetical protein OG393_30960 [Streptomyces sp. NBC_01216]|uniref:hypothetical protein n=1 Tax=Streptomyces sp. NBC_01216 TaxID=2903778 RepID=UPI002E1032AD|nr:hypothetical protein OG393_30960 [Streptomyces sp. NBC_01216]